MTIHLVVERLYFGEELFNMELINLLLEYFMIGVTVVVVAGRFNNIYNNLIIK